MKKYFIEVELRDFKGKFYLGMNMKTGKYIIRNTRKAKTCFTFDTLEIADDFIKSNEKYFVDHYIYIGVGTRQYDTNVDHYDYLKLISKLCCQHKTNTLI